MEKHTSCSAKGDGNQPRIIPQDTTNERIKRLESNLDTGDKCEFVGYGRAVTGDDGALYGPFRLKDGLFFSLSPVVVDKEFLTSNKISHIMAIDEEIGRAHV